MRKKIHIKSSSDVARKLCKDIVEEIAAYSYTPEDVFKIQLAIEEAMINAVEHGNKSDPLKTVTVEYSITAKEFDITITDEGNGFALEKVPDCRNDENLNNVTGRGIVLMRSCMDSVEYNERGNRVRMIKHGR